MSRALHAESSKCSKPSVLLPPLTLPLFVGEEGCVAPLVIRR